MGDCWTNVNQRFVQPNFEDSGYDVFTTVKFEAPAWFEAVDP